MTDDKDYDALAANIAESEGNGDLAHALHQLSQVKAKLAEVEAERDAFASNIPDAAQNLIRNAHTGRLKALHRAKAAEARIAHLENHIEAVAKDTHKIMVNLASPLRDPRVAALPKPSVAEWPYWTVCPKVLEEIRQDAGEWAGEAYLQTVEAIALAVVRRIDALSALEKNK